MKEFNKKISLFLKILGPLIFIYILWRIDYQVLLEKIELIKWPFLILAMTLVVSTIIIKSMRWQTILSALEITISKKTSIKLYWLGLFAGIITPGRLGELIKVYFLKIRKYDFFRSFFSIILDRISDILVLLFLGTLIFLFFLKEIGIYVMSSGLILLLIIICIFSLVAQKGVLHKIFSRLFKKILPAEFTNYSRFTFKKFWQAVKKLKKKRIICFFVYLFLSWLFHFLTRYTVALSLGLNLSFIEITIISSLVAIVILLPISIAGLGTRELSIIYLFGLFGLNRETAVLFSLLIFAIDSLIISLGLIFYLKESSFINKIKTGKIK